MLRKLTNKFAIGALCAFALVACSETIDGMLTNSEVLTFNAKKGSDTVQPGKWQTIIKFKSKTDVRLIIDIPTNKKATEVAFKVPKNTPLPEENGTFELSSKDSGQPYDVTGSINTTHEDSEEQWKTEGCVYQVQRQECHYNGHHPVCYWVTYDVHGWRDVRYFMRTTTQKVNFNLWTQDGSRTAGAFNGTEQSHRRMYTYQSMCR